MSASPKASTSSKPAAKRHLAPASKMLSKNKIEIEQRLARVDDSFHIREGIGLDFEELRLRQAQLSDLLAGVEIYADLQDACRPPERRTGLVFKWASASARCRRRWRR